MSVLALNRLAAGDIAFGSNSWDAPAYEPELRFAINRWEDERMRMLGCPVLRVVR